MSTPSNSSKSSFWLSAAPLFLVLFIDGMGLGLVIPILNALIMDPNSGFFTNTYTPTMHNVIYGAIMGIYMLCWFFGAAILGDVSDQIGRKKSLMICLVGAFLGYLLAAAAILLHSISLLILGRIIAGFTAGSQPIAQAAIVDISEPEHKARNIGLILLALSVGFIVGPIIGGILSSSQLSSWFGLYTPMYFASGVSLLNAILLTCLFKETFTATRKINIQLQHAIKIFLSAFHDSKIKHLSIIFLIFIFGWSSFYSFIAMFLLKIYNFDPMRVSFYMALMGIGFGIGNGFLVNYVSKRFTQKNNIIFSLLSAAVFVTITVTSRDELYAWLAAIPLTCAVSVGYASLLTLFSNQVDANSQGWIMGITGSIMALAWGIDGIGVSLLAAININLPLAFSVFGLVLAIILTYFMIAPNSTLERQSKNLKAF